MRLRFALVATALVVITLSQHKQDKQASQPIEKSSEEIQSWLKNYYKDYPIGGKWNVQSIEISENQNILVYVEIPTRQLSAPTFEQWAANLVCPNQHEAVWSMLGKRRKIYIMAKHDNKLSKIIECETVKS